MAKKPKIEGADKLLAQLKALERKSRKDNNLGVIVGYTANYALSVHENLEMKLKGQPRKKPHKGRYWDPQGRGQSKYLEQPYRENRSRIYNQVVQIMRASGSLQKALLVAGLFLQRISQRLVPVDTGNLKASAFTRIEK